MVLAARCGGSDSQNSLSASKRWLHEALMRADIHPKYSAITVTCGCGNTFQTRSTTGEDMRIDVCSSCHPFFTGKQKVADTGGRVDKFKKRFVGLRKV
jgi:large subunit ribosomal protein L31